MDSLEKSMQRKSQILDKIKAAEKAGDTKSVALLKSELNAIEKQIEKQDSPENAAQGFKQEPLVGYNYLKIEYPAMEDDGESKEKGKSKKEKLIGEN